MRPLLQALPKQGQYQTASRGGGGGEGKFIQEEEEEEEEEGLFKADAVNEEPERLRVGQRHIRPLPGGMVDNV